MVQIPHNNRLTRFSLPLLLINMFLLVNLGFYISLSYSQNCSFMLALVMGYQSNFLIMKTLIQGNLGLIFEYRLNQILWNSPLGFQIVVWVYFSLLCFNF